MVSFVKNIFHRNTYRSALYILVVWVLGLALGFLMSKELSSVYFPIIPQVAATRLKFWLKLFFQFLPISTTWIFVKTGRFICLRLIAFFRAFFTALFIQGCVCVFGSAGWLVYRMLLFSDILLNVLLLYSWLIFSLYPQKRLTKSFCVWTFTYILMFCMMDYFIVSKFLVSLITC